MATILEQLWRYNNWANEILFKAADSSGTQFPPGCLRLLSHIVNGQSTWLGRVIGDKKVVQLWEEHDLDTCKRIHQETAQGFKKAIEQLSADPNITVAYTNSRGTSYQNTLSDILIQVFNHGTYHRAQIATEMRKNGLEPVNTDYINFVR
jgi:uncharacterized damage-inducible protein DinB